jgi:TP901 family phage tail tape measure protein
MASPATIGLQIALDGAKDFTSGLAGIGKSLTSLDGALSLALGAVTKLVEGLDKGIKFLNNVTDEYGEFDDSMRTVAATMGMSAEAIASGSDEFQKLETAAKKAGQTTRYTAKDAAEALNYLALAGYDADKAVAAMPAVLRMAQAGGMGLALASDLVTDSMGAMKMSTEAVTDEFGNTTIPTFDHYVDVLAKTSQKSNTNIQQLGEGFLKVAGAATNFGLSAEDVSAQLGILANNGVKSADAGIHLRNVLMAVYTPIGSKKDVLQDLLGGDATDEEIAEAVQQAGEAQAALKSLGLATYDASGNMRPFEDVLRDLNGQLKDLDPQTRNDYLTKIFNKTDINSISFMLASLEGDGVGSLNALQAEIENAGGAGAMMAETMESGLAGAGRSFDSATEGFRLSIGGMFSDFKRDKMNEVTGYIREFTDVINTSGGDLTKIGDGLGAFLADVVNMISAYLPQIVEVGKSIIGSLGNALLEALPTLIPIITDIVLSVADSIISALPQVANAAVELVGMLSDGILRALPGAITAVSELITNVIAGFATLAPSLINSVISAVLGIAQALSDNLPIILDAVMALALGISKGLVDGIKTLTTALPSIINSLVEFLKNGVPELIKTVVIIVKELVTAVLDALPLIIDQIPKIINEIIPMLLDQIPVLVTAVLEIIIAVADKLPNIIQSIVDIIPSLIDSVIYALTDTLPQIITAITDILPQLVVSLVGAITKSLPPIMLGIMHLVSSIVTALPDILTNIIDAVTEIAPAILEALIDTLPLFVDLGVELFMATMQEQPKMIATITKAAVEIVGALIAGIGKSVSKIAIKWYELSKPLLDMLAEAFVAVGDWFVLVGKAVGDWFVSIGKAVGDWFVSIGKAVGNFFVSLGGTIGNFFTQTVPNFFSGLWNTITNFLAQIPSKVLNAITTIGSVVYNFFEELPRNLGYAIGFMFGKILKFGADCVNWVTTELPLIIQGIGDWFAQLPGKIWGSITTTFNFIVEWGMNVGAKALEIGKNFLDTIVSFFTLLPGVIWETTTSAFNSIKTWGGNIINSAAETGTSFLDTIVSFFTQLPGKIWDSITSAFNFIVGWGSNVGAKALEIGQNFIDTIVSFFTILPGVIWENITSAFNSIKTWGGNIINSAAETGKSFLDTIVSFFTQLPGKASEMLTTTLDNAKTFFTNLIDTAATQMKNVFDTIVNALADLPNQMKQIGINIVSGIWEGIKSMGDWLGEKVSGFFGGLVDGIKDGLGIHSPSKVFAEIGGYMGEGVGVGFASEMSGVRKIMNAVVPKTIDLPNITAPAFNAPNVAASPYYALANAANSPTANSGTVINQNTTITTPKALSEREIMRQMDVLSKKMAMSL